MSFRRNLVILVAHGLRSDALGDEQVWPLRTPNFDKLAKHGLRLIATSACPADPGGMVSLLTGLHARQHGRVEQTTEPARCEGWPAALWEAGYHTVGVGRVEGIERWLRESVVVSEVDAVSPARCAYLDAMRAKSLYNDVISQRRQRTRGGPFEPDRLLLDPEDDVDGFILNEATRRLETMPTDRPWALIVFLTGPGNDLPAPHLYGDVVDPAALAGDFVPANFSSLDAMVELDYPRVMLQRLDRTRIGHIRAEYLGRVSLIDHGVGRLHDAVRQREDINRTWMLTTSDRGCLLGEHGVVGHRSFLAGAVEVPLILTPPTPSAEATTDDLVSTVDVAATINMLAGCDPNTTSVGRSLLPLIAGEAIARAATGLISEFGNRLLLETERYKVVFDVETHKSLALYDMLNDPDEIDNLLTTNVGRNLLDALRWRVGDALMSLRAQ